MEAHRLYGYRLEEAIGRVTHELLESQFPARVMPSTRPWRPAAGGRASFVTAARTAAG